MKRTSPPLFRIVCLIIYLLGKISLSLEKPFWTLNPCDVCIRGQQCDLNSCLGLANVILIMFCGKQLSAQPRSPLLLHGIVRHSSTFVVSGE